MKNATINPLCCVCLEPIGSMTLDIYLKAIETRGEYLFCPDCRKHKCDSCGWFIPGEIMTKNYKNGEFLGSSCETCTTWVINSDDVYKEDFPHFLTNVKPNLTYISAMSPMLEDEARWDER